MSRASFHLDVRPANHASVIVILLADKGAEFELDVDLEVLWPASANVGRAREPTASTHSLPTASCAATVPDDDGGWIDDHRRVRRFRSAAACAPCDHDRQLILYTGAPERGVVSSPLTAKPCFS
jgi:hypothetical protein